MKPIYDLVTRYIPIIKCFGTAMMIVFCYMWLLADMPM